MTEPRELPGIRGSFAVCVVPKHFESCATYIILANYGAFPIVDSQLGQIGATRYLTDIASPLLKRLCCFAKHAMIGGRSLFVRVKRSQCITFVYML